MLEARNLTKRYQTQLAVVDVSFCIQPGEILGYLGPNGSGKSTTINAHGKLRRSKACLPA